MSSVLLADKAYQQIKANILRTVYPPNSPLPEAELQRSLNMGRTPVREALIRLQQEGLVQIVPRRGAFVQSLTPSSARALYQVRSILEPEAVRLAHPYIVPAELDEFELRFRRLLDADQDIDAEQFIEVDQQFHQFFLHKCGNRFLVEALERLHNQSQLAWAISARDRERMVAAWKAHIALINALRDSDVDEAAEIMRDHVLTMYQTIVAWTG